MRRTLPSYVVVVLSTLALAASLAAPSSAQTEPTGEIAEIILVDALPGHGPQLEEGVKRHFEVARAQNAPWAWFMWEIMTGENTGKYYVGTFGHAWSDFDQPPADPEALRDSFRQNISPHVERAQAGFWRMRAELSRLPAEMGDMPPPFDQVFYYKPTLAGASELEAVFREIKGAADAASWSEHWEVYQLVNGGEMPLYAVALPEESFAGFAEPTPNMGEMLGAHFGEQGAQALFQRFVAAVEWEKSEAIAFRQDLSYVPGM